MDVSIIIPTHQRPLKAAACVAGLASQAFDGQFEILVGIDGTEEPGNSTAEAVDAALHAPCGSAAITIEKFEKQGQASVRNRLLDRARGRILVFLNDDMVPQPDFLTAHFKAQHECIQAGQPALVVGESPWKVYKPDRFFDRLIRDTSMVFFYDKMRDSSDRDHDWGFRHAWLLNLSAPADLVKEAGGFTVFPSTYGYEDGKSVV